MIFSALACGGFFSIFRFVRRIRLIQDTPTSRIRSAPQGYVELTGMSRNLDGQVTLAPLSGKPCTWYSYKIEARSDRPHRQGHHELWKVIESGTSHEFFLIVDDTGACMIDPDGASVIPTQTNVWHGKNLEFARLKEGHHRELSEWLYADQYRYTEQRIPTEVPIYVIGQFITLSGAHDALQTRAEISRLLQQWKQDNSSLLQRFDVNADGKIDLDEWEQARAAAQDAITQTQHNQAAEAGINVIRKPEHGEDYIISGIAQEKMLSRMRFYILLGLLAFFGAGGMVVWMLSLR